MRWQEPWLVGDNVNILAFLQEQGQTSNQRKRMRNRRRGLRAVSYPTTWSGACFDTEETERYAVPRTDPMFQYAAAPQPPVPHKDAALHRTRRGCGGERVKEASLRTV